MSLNDASVPVAVIGLGCWYPEARNPLQFWENILTRRRAFRQIPACRLPLDAYYHPDRRHPDTTYGRKAALIDGFTFDGSARRIPQGTVQATDIVHWLALETAHMAVADAGFTPNTVPAEHTGVIIGNTLTGEQTRATTLRLRWPFVRKALRAAAGRCGLSGAQCGELEAAMEARYKAVFPPVTEDTLAGGLANTIAGRICYHLNLQGGGYTVDGACSSSLLAVATAMERLTRGDLELALVGGVDISLDPFELVGFAKTGALTAGDMHVYDRRGSGFIPGEGCGFAVLKRFVDARRDGNPVYAVIHGWGISSDGRASGITAPSVGGQVRAIRQALARTPFTAAQLDFIEGHGTGTMVGDRTELAAVSAVLDALPDVGVRSCGMTSLKSIIGHAKAASGIGGFIKAVMAVNRRTLPPTAGCREPHPVFENQAAIYPILHGAPREPEAVLRAGVSSMGFGGINCHVTLSSADAPSEKLASELGERVLLASHQSTEVFVLTAASAADLALLAAQTARMAEGISQAEMTDLAAHMAGEAEPASAFRAAVVAAAPEELAERLDRLSGALVRDPAAQTAADPLVRWGRPQGAPRCGLIFPGQGAQQINMARTLVERFDWARDLLHLAESKTGTIDGRSLGQWMFRDMERAADETQARQWRQALARTQVAQPAVCLASVLWMRFLETLGIRPAVVGGHSLGEVTAFLAAGALDAPTFFEFVALRGRVMAEASLAGGGMAALACDAEKAEQLIREANGYVVLANRNSARQCVVSGENAAVDTVLRIAADRGVQARRLNVSGAFHSRLMAAAAQRIEHSGLLPERVGAMTCDLFGAVHARRICPGDPLAAYMSEQVLAGVRFSDMIAALAQSCDLLVECGPGRALSGLAADCFPEGQPPCLAVEARAEEDQDLNTILAAAWVAGSPIHWPALYARRLIRTFTPPSEKCFIVNPCERPMTIESDNEAAAPLAAGIPALLEPGLAAGLADVAPARLDAYLRQRGGFLAGVIRADLESLAALRLTPEAAPSADPAALPAPHALPVVKDDAQPAADLDLMGELLQLIQQNTGFAPETIDPRFRLLDDLNLDSIKAADLLSRFARRAGVRWPEDPAVLANARLAEIIEAVTRLRAAQGGATSGDDHADPRENLPPSWVRNFNLAYVRRDLLSKEHPGWQGILIQIVHAEADRTLASALAGRLQAEGARTVLSCWSPGEALVGAPSGEPVWRIAVMPMESAGLARAASLLPRIVAFRAGVLPVAGDRLSGLTLIQSGGAMFGRKQPHTHFAAAGCRALAAAVHLEHPDLPVCVVDLAHELVRLDPDRAAAAAIAEMADRAPYRLAAYDARGGRWVPQPALSQPSAYKARDLRWTARDVIVVSGGGKGITAECALAAAQTCGARLALLGSTPMPPEGGRGDGAGGQILQTLEKMTAAGIDARYYACDLVDAGAVAAVVARIRREQGPIKAVIHGAGLNRPRPVVSVRADEALAEIAPKVLGLLNLWEALGPGRSPGDEPPALIVGLSSIIGVTGMAGNAWYGFSNEMLDLLLSAIIAESEQTRTQSVAFSIWAQTGMGARMGSVARLARLGIDAIADDQGIARFADLFARDPGHPMVIVTARLSGLDTWSPPEPEIPRQTRFCRRPKTITPGVEGIFSVRLDIGTDPYLADHVYQGACLFPTVFGLEAMAQALAATAGIRSFERLRFEDVQLRRPITVDADEGADLVIWVQVDERDRPGAPLRARAGIRKSGSGSGEDHFSAVLIVDPEGEAADSRDRPSDDAPGTGSHPDLIPLDDLYRPSLLFQGPLFQRITRVQALAGNSRDQGSARLEALRVGATEAGRRAFTDREAGPTFLPDPFFSDALLQSAALLVPQDPCLPVSIDCFELRAGGETETLRVTVELEGRRDQVLRTRVRAWDTAGRMAACLTGYHLKILKHVDDYPTVEDLMAPQTRDGRLLRALLERAAQRFEVDLPEWVLACEPGIHGCDQAERRRRCRPLLEQALKRAAQRWQTGPDDPIPVIWKDSGKPASAAGVEGGLDLSLSHDERLCLAAAGPAPQGCDIAPLSRRAREAWIDLLGSASEALLADLTALGDSLDEAGTRLWAAREAAFKAVQSPALRLDIAAHHETGVLLRASGTGRELMVLTVGVALTWGPFRILALVVEPRATARTRSADGVGERFLGLCARPAYEVLPEGPNGELIFVQRFPVTFKPGAQLSRNVYFTNYFDWMGHAREASTFPIMRELIDLLSTGLWGSVTNYSRLEVLGEARTGDLIEVRMWTSANGGPQNGTMTLQYDFRRICPGGSRNRLAFAELQTTWVRLTGHGLAKPAPYPPVLQRFFADMIPRGRPPEADRSLPAPFADWHRPGEDDPLYQAAPGPVIRPQLASKAFETSQGQSNAVGNVYYAKYYEWQGQLRDAYLRAAVPECFGGTGELGEAVCLSCRVDHLREAMPFDTVLVTMSLAVLHAGRARLHFDYFRLEPGKNPVKLAWGVHDMAWVARDAQGRPMPAAFPAALGRAFDAAVADLPGHNSRCAPGSGNPMVSAA